MLTDIPEEGVGGANPFLRRAEESHKIRRKKREHKMHRVDESRQDSWIDRARQGVHCSLFCGGKKCKFERWNSLSRELRDKAAIEGLNSNWVGPYVIASQRPSTSLFLKYLLIQQFKALEVSGVVNLQEKGEHGSCGPDGISESTGYSYSGVDDLMPNGIAYYEFPWPDMTAPEQDVVLRSVQVMDYHIRNKGKVLVHCHAGLGRTGLMIACYYVYSQHMPSAEAIKLVRECRPGAIQTERQFKFICAFEKHIWRLSQAFCIEISDSRIDVEIFVRRQRHFLHGQESDFHRYTPVFLHGILCRLINLTRNRQSEAEMALHSLGASASPDAKTLLEYRRMINRRQLDVTKETNERILGFLVCDWFRSMSVPALSSTNCDAIVAFQRGRGFKLVSKSSDQAAMSETVAVEEEERETTQLVRSIMSPPVRHTLGMVVSAVECISQSAKLEVVRRSAYCSLVDSFNHAFNPIKLRYAPVERGLLYDFFEDWGRSVGDMYFNENSAPASSRTIRRVARASRSVLAETAVISAPVLDEDERSCSTVYSPASQRRRMTRVEEVRRRKSTPQVFRAFFLDDRRTESPLPTGRIHLSSPFAPQPSPAENPTGLASPNQSVFTSGVGSSLGTTPRRRSNSLSPPTVEKSEAEGG